MDQAYDYHRTHSITEAKRLVKLWVGPDETKVIMEVNRIEDKAEANISEGVNLRRFGGQACIYYPEVSCSSPKLQFKICRACPKCARFVQVNVERNLFQHIKAYAISLLDKMNIQASK